MVQVVIKLNKRQNDKVRMRMIKESINRKADVVQRIFDKALANEEE